MALIQKIIKNRKEGYTVIEVMIVLSVSTLLFASAVVAYSGQNRKTQFTNSVRDMETKIQDILNDVSTGYSPSSGNFTCTRSGSPAVPIINPTEEAEQGKNQDCIFLGKEVIINNRITAFTLLGLRNKSTDADSLSTNVDEAENRLLTVPGSFNASPINANVAVQKIVFGDAPGSPAFEETGSLGFVIVSGFGNGNLGGAGATTTQAVVSSRSPEAGKAVNDAELLNRDVTICLREPGGGRQASIKISSGAQGNIETMIDGWAVECN